VPVTAKGVEEAVLEVESDKWFNAPDLTSMAIT